MRYSNLARPVFHLTILVMFGDKGHANLCISFVK